MDSRFADFDADDAGSIYEYAARSVLALYKDFVKGTPSATLGIVSEHPLPAEATEAVRASAERLGYGRDGCIWVTMRGNAPHTSGNAKPLKIGEQDLRTIVESVDPLSLITTDAFSAHALARAYGEACNINSANRINGRPTVSLGDFPLMLKDDAEKQKAWHLMKTLRLD